MKKFKVTIDIETDTGRYPDYVLFLKNQDDEESARLTAKRYAISEMGWILNDIKSAVEI